MPAFELITELLNYFRKTAQNMGCDPCFDGKMDEILKMNENGSNGIPGCLCRIGIQCPCDSALHDIENEGTCYCEIFVKKKILR